MRLNQFGQAILLVVLVLGVILSGVVFFGSSRITKVTEQVTRMEGNQIAQEVLWAAAKRVQQIYSNEAACDPRVLDARLGRLTNLPTDPSSMQVGAGSYVVAQPASTAFAARMNLCSSVSGTGCRQIVIPGSKGLYIVTVGAVSREPAAVGRTTTDCPRDAQVRLNVAIEGNSYSQKFYLMNLCTITSCAGSSFGDFAATAIGTADAGGSTFQQTTACGNLGIRYYGAIVNSTATTVGVDDLRWARRFVETGAGSVGETTYMVTASSIASGNGSCTSAASSNQCIGGNCVPAFDLNKDGKNDDQDLAILELFLRGFMYYLPAVRLL